MELFDQPIINIKQLNEQEIFKYLIVRFTMLAKLRVGGKEAEDIAHDACLTIIEKIREGKVPENFYPWAYEILRNKIGNFYNRQKKQKEIMSQADIHTLVNYNFIVPDPNIRLSLLDCMKKQIKSNPQQAKVLHLVYQGFNTEEICQQLSIKSGYMYVLLGRSRRMLKKCLKKE